MAFHNTDTEKDDGAREETEGLDIDKDKILRIVQACSPENGGMGFCVPASIVTSGRDVMPGDRAMTYDQLTRHTQIYQAIPATLRRVIKCF